MSTKQIVLAIVILFSVASAICWIKSALIPPTFPMAYLSGPPKDVADSIRSQSRWNAYAASCAAVAAIAQGILPFFP